MKEKVSSLREKLRTGKNSKVLKNPVYDKHLRDLQRDFVIVPIDKATGNIGFVCKRFYAEVLVNELGLKYSSHCDTYEEVFGSVENIVCKDSEVLKSKFSINNQTESKKLPHMYWLPKLHKNPVKFRFIVAAPDCSIKPLAKALTKIFKLFYRQIECYNNKSYFYSHIKSFWIIQNNEDVINCINKLNRTNSVKSMSTFDFSTLYTKIPHQKLIEVLNELIDFCFKGGSHKMLSVSNSGARWVSRGNKNSVIFDKASVKDSLKYLMNNCFFTLGNKVFRQVIGIPMGSDPAPFMANLFLYFYENKWVRTLKKTDLNKARKFRYTFRFIDDLITINDNGLFEKYHKEIYPEEQQLNLEGSGDRLSFLDLDLTKNNGQLDVKLFHKRDLFPFSIVRLPYASSNIPSNMFYSSISAEILRIGRISSNFPNFLASAKSVIDRACKQGATSNILSKSLKKIFGRQEVLKRFSQNAAEFVSNLI